MLQFGKPVMWYLTLTFHLNLGSGKFGFTVLSVLKWSCYLNSIPHGVCFFSNPISRLRCTGCLNCPGNKEQGQYFSQRLLVLHLWFACRHLGMERDAASAQHINTKSVCCPRLNQGNHPNKADKKPSSKWISWQTKWMKLMELVHVMLALLLRRLHRQTKQHKHLNHDIPNCIVSKMCTGWVVFRQTL